MSFIDRYTILRWKEAGRCFVDDFIDRFFRLYAMGNATTTTRLISLGTLLVAVFLVWGLLSLLRPEPPLPLSKRLVLTSNDDQGDVWTMDYLKNQDLNAILDGPVKPGEPLTLNIKFLRNQRNLLITLEIVGAAGERYFPGILKNGQWQEPPGLAIADQNDKLLHKGKFEYG